MTQIGGRVIAPNGIFQITLLSTHTKQEKVGRVCNAAVKYKSCSLNDKLISGPDLLRNLLGIIFRFREKQYAITADIENECKFFWFLWR